MAHIYQERGGAGGLDVQYQPTSLGGARSRQGIASAKPDF